MTLLESLVVAPAVLAGGFFVVHIVKLALARRGYTVMLHKESKTPVLVNGKLLMLGQSTRIKPRPSPPIMTLAPRVSTPVEVPGFGTGETFPNATVRAVAVLVESPDNVVTQEIGPSLMNELFDKEPITPVAPLVPETFEHESTHAHDDVSHDSSSDSPNDSGSSSDSSDDGSSGDW